MTLIYCNYPILDHGDQPDWVGLLHYVGKKGSLQNVKLYQPFYSIAEQGLDDVLSIPRLERDKQLYQLADLLRLDHMFITYRVQSDKPNRPDYNDIITLESQSKPFSHHVIIKDMWVLSRCDVIVTDLNTPDHGTKDSLNLIARMFGIPIVGVCDRFISGPWLHATCDFTVKTLQLADLLEMLAKKLEQQLDDASTETTEGQTDGVQLQDS